MIDEFTYQQCQNNSKLLEVKIRNLKHAIKESELIINESNIDEKSLIHLKRKINSSLQDLEALYLIKSKEKA